MDLRLLGHLKKQKDRYFEYFEYQFLQWAHKILAVEWHIVQGASDLEGMIKWFEIFVVLELDQNSQLDLLYLAQHGASGRVCANKVLGYLRRCRTRREWSAPR